MMGNVGGGGGGGALTVSSVDKVLHNTRNPTSGTLAYALETREQYKIIYTAAQVANSCDN